MNRIFIKIPATSKFMFFRLGGFGRNSPCGVGAIADLCYKCKLKVFIRSYFFAKSIPWKAYFFQVSLCMLKAKADFLQTLFPEGNGFQMKIQIQTRLMNAIWGSKSENSARVPIAYSPGGARSPRRGPIAYSRCQAGQRLSCDCPILRGLPIHRGSALGLWIALQLAEPGEARPQPLAQPPAGAWSITSRPQQ